MHGDQYGEYADKHGDQYGDGYGDQYGDHYGHQYGVVPHWEITDASKNWEPHTIVICFRQTDIFIAGSFFSQDKKNLQMSSYDFHLRKPFCRTV